MARSSWTQANFLGGAWSSSAQGRLDLPEYRSALAQCTNAFPQEEGSVTLRSGTRMCGPTSNGQFGVTFAWDIAGQAFYDVEVSVAPGVGSSVRFWQGDQPVMDSTDTLASISSANPAVITTNHTQTWNTGDFVMIQIPTGSLTGTTGWAPILNRQLKITRLTSTTFSLTGVNGATLPGAIPAGTAVGHIASLAGPWTQISQLFQICPVFATFNGLQLYLFTFGVQPLVITMTALPTSSTWPTFTTATPYFQGPYQPFTFNQNGSVSAASGTVTLTDTGSVHPNNGTGFQSTDVGRAIRLLSQPPAWNSGTAYTAGQAVMWNNVAYQATASSTGKQPDQNPASWFVEPDLIVWVDGTITAFTNSTTVSVNFNGTVIPSTNGLTITTFTLGVYNVTFNVWPSCGTFHEGRLWLAGAVQNEIDGSEVDLPTSFRPTDVNSNVLSSSAISYQIFSPSNNQTYWLVPDQGGIALGTQTEEWLVSSTNNNNILTPTTMQAHRQTKYGSLLHQPIHAGLSYVFIQRYGNIIYEYLVDPFVQRFGALPLNARAKTVSSFLSQLTYAATPVPTIWGRTFAGGLAGCTYRRTSRFLNQPPDFHGWHNHSISGVAPFISAVSTSAYPGPGGAFVDAVPIVTSTGFLTGSSYRQILMPPYNPALGDQYAWHLDGAVTGIYANSSFQPNIFVGLSAIEDGTNMYFLGLWYQPGTVSVYIAGIYFGDFPVVNGAVTVPYGSDPAGIGTRSYLATQGVQIGTNGACTIQGLGTLPVLIGSKFTSTIKLLRQDVQDEARTPNGMAVGETRRPYMASANLAVGYNNMATIGVDNQPAYPVVFRQYTGGPANANNAAFQGIWQDTILADESYDGQLVLNITGPYPFVLNNITPFAETEER